MPIMLLPMFLWSFGLIPCLLVGFLRLWPFNFFLTSNSMDCHETRGVPSLGILRIHVQVFNSIPCGNPKKLASYCGYWIESLMGERGKTLKLSSNVLIQYLSGLWATLGLHAPILSPIFSLEPHLRHFHLESERGASVWEHKHIIFNQEGSNTHFKEKNSSQTKILN